MSTASVLIEGDLIGSTKQRVQLELKNATLSSIVDQIFSQLYDSASNAPVPVPKNGVALYYYDVMQGRYLPCNELSIFKDRVRIKVVEACHPNEGVHPVKRGENGEVHNGVGNSSDTQDAETLMIEFSALVVTTVIADTSFALTSKSVDDLLDVVMKRHAEIPAQVRESARGEGLTRLKNQLLNAFLVGQQRKMPHPLEQTLREAREMNQAFKKKLFDEETMKLQWMEKAKELEDENRKIREAFESSKAQSSDLTPNGQLSGQMSQNDSFARPMSGSVTPGYPSVPPPTPASVRMTSAPISGSQTPTFPPTPCNTPANGLGGIESMDAAVQRLQDFQQHDPSTPDFRSPNHSSVRITQNITPTKVIPFKLAPAQEQVTTPHPTAPSTTVTHTYSSLADSQGFCNTFMVSCFYNMFDPLRKMNVKMGKAIAIPGPVASVERLKLSIAKAFGKDLALGYTHPDGTRIIVDSDEALMAYLKLHQTRGSRPILQCFDMDLPSQHPAEMEEQAGQNLHMPVPPVYSRTPSPGVYSNAPTPRSVSSFSMASSIPIDYSSGSILDEEEIRSQFSRVTKDGQIASKEEVKRYLQSKYDDMGDPKRFQRILDKFKGVDRKPKNWLNFDEFAIVMLRISAS